MESSYGEVLSDPKIVKSVIRSLATLAYADRRRAKFGRQQLVAALKILQRGDISIAGMTGSWAGAMGHTQFIPTTYEAYAVDFDGDGRRDLWNSPADALGSAANYLQQGRAGCRERPGATRWCCRRLQLSARRGREVAHDQRVEEARRRACGGDGFPRPGDKAVLIAPAGASGPAFLMLRNHFVIKRYNNATAYSLAVGHLADRLRGGGDFRAVLAGDERPLTADESAELQQHLAARRLL